MPFLPKFFAQHGEWIKPHACRAEPLPPRLHALAFTVKSKTRGPAGTLARGLPAPFPICCTWMPFLPKPFARNGSSFKPHACQAEPLPPRLHALAFTVESKTRWLAASPFTWEFVDQRFRCYDSCFYYRNTSSRPGSRQETDDQDWNCPSLTSGIILILLNKNRNRSEGKEDKNAETTGGGKLSH